MCCTLARRRLAARLLQIFASSAHLREGFAVVDACSCDSPGTPCLSYHWFPVVQSCAPTSLRRSNVTFPPWNPTHGTIMSGSSPRNAKKSCSNPLAGHWWKGGNFVGTWGFWSSTTWGSLHITNGKSADSGPVLDSDVTAQPLHSCVGRAERNQMHCLKLWGDLSIWTRETPTAPLLLRLCQRFTVTHCYLFVICCLWLMNPITMEYGKITIISLYI